MFSEKELKCLVLDYLVNKIKNDKYTFKSLSATKTQIVEKNPLWFRKLCELLNIDVNNISDYDFKKKLYNFLLGKELKLVCVCGSEVKKKIIDGCFLKTCGSPKCASDYKFNPINEHLSFHELISKRLDELKNTNFSRDSLLRLIKEYIFFQFDDDMLEIKQTNQNKTVEFFKKYSGLIWARSLLQELNNIETYEDPPEHYKHALYLFVHNMDKRPCCPYCETPLRLRTFFQGYTKSCGGSCSGFLTVDWMKESGLFESIHSKMLESSNSKDGRAKAFKRRRERYYNHLIMLCKNRGIEFLHEKDEFLIDGLSKKYNFKCLKCNTIFEEHPEKLTYVVCPKCTKVYYYRTEKIFGEMLENLGYKVKEDFLYNKYIIPGYQIDFYFPKQKIGFEINGIYWHSKDRYKNLHKEKADVYAQAGIRLVQFWEDMVYEKLDIVSGYTASILGNQKIKKVYARNCEIVELDSSEACNFHSKYHLFGCPIFNTTAINLGLKLDGKLISVLSALKRSVSGTGKPRLEIVRYTNHPDFNVIGGFSRLLSHLEKRLKNVILETFLHLELNNIPETSVYSRHKFIYTGYQDTWYIFYRGKRYHRLKATLKFLREEYYDRFGKFPEEDDNLKGVKLTQQKLLEILEIPVLRTGIYKFEKYF